MDAPSGTKVENDNKSKASRFRFKSKSRNRRHDEDDKHGQHHRSKRTKTRHRRVDDPPDAYDDSYNANTRSREYLSPDVAFRESLFDALADDEGAAYWEGVYGQPIHNYSSERPGPDGELEQMSEDEYAAHVRAKMWEKTHQHVIEERERRDAAHKRREQTRRETAHMERDKEAFEQEIQDSLRRGADRKRKAHAKERWTEYIKQWDDLTQSTASEESVDDVAKNLPWPTETGKMRHVSREEVESFFRHAAAGSEMLAILKVERVRWHPDKIQQRFSSSQALDDKVVKAVTAVFQVVDQMWNEQRKKS